MGSSYHLYCWVAELSFVPLNSSELPFNFLLLSLRVFDALHIFVEWILSSCDWFISLSIMSLRLICVSGYGIFPSSLRWKNIPMCPLWILNTLSCLFIVPSNLLNFLCSLRLILKMLFMIPHQWDIKRMKCSEPKKGLRPERNPPGGLESHSCVVPVGCLLAVSGGSLLHLINNFPSMRRIIYNLPGGFSITYPSFGKTHIVGNRLHFPYPHLLTLPIGPGPASPPSHPSGPHLLCVLSPASQKASWPWMALVSLKALSTEGLGRRQHIFRDSKACGLCFHWKF